jgi:hypothetical protein
VEPIRSSWRVPVHRSRGIIAGLAVVCLAGCSLALSGPDSKQARNKSPDCDRTKGLVALDGLASGVMGLTGFALLADGEEAAAAPLVISAVYALAAVYGNSTVNECRAAVAKYEDATRANDLTAMPEGTLPGRPSRAALKRGVDAHTGVPNPPLADPFVEAHQTGPVAKPAPPTTTAPAQPPVAQPPPAPSPPVRPPPPPASDPWREFWREVP